MWSLTHGILVTLALPDGRGRIDTRERRCGHNDMRELCFFKLYLMNMSDYNNSRVWNL